MGSRTVQLMASQARSYGCDPYNTADSLVLTKQIVSHYHGPLTAVAYRDQRYWDFASGVSSAEKINTYVPALLRRQAD